MSLYQLTSCLLNLQICEDTRDMSKSKVAALLGQVLIPWHSKRQS